LSDLGECSFIFKLYYLLKKLIDFCGIYSKL